MRFICISVLLLASFAAGQTPNGPISSLTPLPHAAATSTNLHNAHQPAVVPPESPVITIRGLCDATAAGRKNPAAPMTQTKTSDADCKTIITRAQFDALVSAIQPNMNSDTRRQFAAFYPTMLLLQREFRKNGMEKNPQFKNWLAFATLRAQAEWAARMLQEDADQVSDADVERFYKDNVTSYEQAELQRIFIPKAKQQIAKDNKQELPGSADGRKTDDEALKKEADALQIRAVSGEDFDNLQREAYDMAGMQVISPSTKLGMQTANQLPAGHQSVLTLSVGDVSQVITDDHGYFIYKIVSRSVEPLEQARSDIKDRLAQQKFKLGMQKIEATAKTELNQAYFPQIASDKSARPSNNAFEGRRSGARRVVGTDANGKTTRVGERPTVPRPVPPASSVETGAAGSAAPETPKY